MKEVVFKIGNGKVVHCGVKYSNGVVSSSCSNTYANERNKGLEECSDLSEITCKTCRANKEWDIVKKKISEEFNEKRKTYEIKKITEVRYGDIYRIHLTPCHSSTARFFKVQVWKIFDEVVNRKVVKRIEYIILNDDLSPDTGNKKKPLITLVTVSEETFKEDFRLITGDARNA